MEARDRGSENEKEIKKKKNEEDEQQLHKK